MEINFSNCGMLLRLKSIFYIGISLALGACIRSVDAPCVFSDICPPVHTLMALTPEFSLRTEGDGLPHHYVRYDKTGEKEFPMTGILRVDGKSYRFMGNDSLRIVPLASLSNEDCGWNAKFSYLYPGLNWQMKEYDDLNWKEGIGAFGAEDCHHPFHTVWGGNDIYIRRYFTIDNPDFKNHELYIRFICDDQMEIYCNGNFAFGTNRIALQYQCEKLSDEVVAGLTTGENVLAVHAHNLKDVALIDFGMYMENKSNTEVDTAILKRMDVCATQTKYVFQCGEVELLLDFVSPTLLNQKDIAMSPVGFITYKVRWEGEESHDVEVMFDVDMEWMYGKNQIEEQEIDDLRLIRSDSLYIGTALKEMNYTYVDGHVRYSQHLINDMENGVFILGYKEKRPIQFEGENLLPYWNKKGERNIEELMTYIRRNHKTLKSNCDKQDGLWNKKVVVEGVKDNGLCMIPAYREFVSTHYFVTYDKGCLMCFGDTLGCVSESFNEFPVLKFYERTDWMKGLLDPVFVYCENVNWPKSFPPYDIGLFPVANRQVSINDCGVEVASFMLKMVESISATEKNNDYATKNMRLLNIWREYLKDVSTLDNYSSAALNQ